MVREEGVEGTVDMDVALAHRQPRGKPRRREADEVLVGELAEDAEGGLVMKDEFHHWPDFGDHILELGEAPRVFLVIDCDVFFPPTNILHEEIHGMRCAWETRYLCSFFAGSG